MNKLFDKRLELIFTLSSKKSFDILKDKVGLYEPRLMVDFLEKSVLYFDFHKKFHDIMILQNDEIFCIDLFCNNKTTKLMINFDKPSLKWFIKEANFKFGERTILTDIIVDNRYVMDIPDAIKFINNYDSRHNESYIQILENSKISPNLN